MVRHTPGPVWHKARDHLRGSAHYGNVDGRGKSFRDNSPFEWSTAFNMIKHDQFMFATGDCKKWLIASTTAVRGKTMQRHGVDYTTKQRKIALSSRLPTRKSAATWYHRKGPKWRPVVSLEDLKEPGKNKGGVLYAENLYPFDTLAITQHAGANVYIRDSTKVDRCLTVCGGGWMLMRHTPATIGGVPVWHRATDNLAGKDVYGNYQDWGAASEYQWSRKWNHIMYTDLLFATGDCFRWLVTTKEAVGIDEKPFGEGKRRIIGSSVFPEESTRAVWKYGAEASGKPKKEDPWIGISDYDVAKNEGTLLYGEGEKRGWEGGQVLAHHLGANVYIRPADQCLLLDRGGWLLVRHKPRGADWFEQTDRLNGHETRSSTRTDRYHNSGFPWSIRWNHISFDEFLFATGDCSKWLIAKKSEVTGEFYGGARGPKERVVSMSSLNKKEHKVAWWNRRLNKEDPKIYLQDGDEDSLLYSEDGENQRVSASNPVGALGANVYIRRSAFIPADPLEMWELTQGRRRRAPVKHKKAKTGDPKKDAAEDFDKKPNPPINPRFPMRAWRIDLADEEVASFTISKRKESQCSFGIGILDKTPPTLSPTINPAHTTSAPSDNPLGAAAALMGGAPGGVGGARLLPLVMLVATALVV